MPTIATNKAEPIIDQTTGKSVPPILRTKKSGSEACLAIHDPINAPIKPITTEITHPPLEKPVSARPIDPQIPAINNRIIISSKDIISP